MEPNPNSRDNLSPQERQRLQEDERRTEVSNQHLVVYRTIRIISYLVGALLVLLALRFFLRLTSANPDNTFASFIFGLSEPFVAPFTTLFATPPSPTGSVVFDINLLVAMAVYALLGWLAVWLVRTIFLP